MYFFNVKAYCFSLSLVQYDEVFIRLHFDLFEPFFHGVGVEIIMTGEVGQG